MPAIRLDMIKKPLLFLITLAVVWGFMARPVPAEVSGDPSGGSPEMIRVTGTAVAVDDPGLPVADRRRAAEREARMDAARRLVEAVGKVTVESGASVNDLIAQDPDLANRIDVFVQGAKVTDVRFFPDGRVEVDAELSLEALDTWLHPTP